MSELTTVARPYAKAAFDFAVEAKAVDNWLEQLTFAAEVAKDETIKGYLSGGISVEQAQALFLGVCGEQVDSQGQNFLKVMAENERLLVLPQVLEQFLALKAEFEQEVTVDVTSAVKLKVAQTKTLSAALEKRLARKVKLNCIVDESIVSGLIIQAGDVVIDGSIQGKLSRLATTLQSQIREQSMQLNSTEIAELIKNRIEQFDVVSEARNEGTIVSVTDGIIRIHGLADVMQGEMIELPGSRYAIALNLDRDSVGAVVMGPYADLAEGQKVKGTGRILEVPVGRGLLGRVVNTLGEPIDGKGPVENDGFSPVEVVAPGVIERKSVDQPVQTGIKSIDSMIPIGRGQRELIIGDRQIGKSAIALDAIINQKNTGIKSIYVAIGQKASTVANVVRSLEEHGALSNTIVVVASASEAAALQYLAPYAGCSMGEYFRDRGEDALIVYDDLSKQAVAYRQISLLLRRPPGREAYPGDVFYLHSRLLERAARVNEAYVEKFTNGEVKGKTGSLTALPIIETQAGDVSAFVPTNVISITDGQIFLESDLFNSGIRPAVNAGLSVSRVGGAAQTKIIKKLGGGIRLALAQYRELAAFAQFASDLDDATRAQLEHGQRVTELMKQKQYSPLSVAETAVSLFAAEKGFLNDVEINKINDFENALQTYMSNNQAELMATINESGNYDKDIEAGLTKALENFKSTQTW